MNTFPALLAQAIDQTDNQHGMIMSVIIWLVVGLVAGFLGSKIVNKRGEGLVLDIILGLVGAFVGGFLFSLVGIHNGGSMILSIVIATVGAIVVLVIYHMIFRSKSRTA